MLTSQQPQCATTWNLSIKSHFARNAWKGGRQCLAKERLCGCNPSIAAEQKIDALALLVERSIPSETAPRILPNVPRCTRALAHERVQFIIDFVDFDKLHDAGALNFGSPRKGCSGSS